MTQQFSDLKPQISYAPREAAGHITNVLKCYAYNCAYNHMGNFSVRINPHDRIVLTICEHIGAEEAVGIGGGKGIGIDEPAVGKVVVPALEVVEARLTVVIVTTVTQGVDVPDEGGIRGLFAVSTMHGVVAPRAVVVRRDERAGGIQKAMTSPCALRT